MEKHSGDDSQKSPGEHPKKDFAAEREPLQEEGVFSVSPVADLAAPGKPPLARVGSMESFSQSALLSTSPAVAAVYTGQGSLKKAQTQAQQIIGAASNNNTVNVQPLSPLPNSPVFAGTVGDKVDKTSPSLYPTGGSGRSRRKVRLRPRRTHDQQEKRAGVSAFAPPKKTPPRPLTMGTDLSQIADDVDIPSFASVGNTPPILKGKKKTTPIQRFARRVSVSVNPHESGAVNAGDDACSDSDCSCCGSCSDSDTLSHDSTSSSYYSSACSSDGDSNNGGSGRRRKRRKEGRQRVVGVEGSSSQKYSTPKKAPSSSQEQHHSEEGLLSNVWNFMFGGGARQAAAAGATGVQHTQPAGVGSHSSSRESTFSALPEDNIDYDVTPVRSTTVSRSGSAVGDVFEAARFAAKAADQDSVATSGTSGKYGSVSTPSRSKPRVLQHPTTGGDGKPRTKRVLPQSKSDFEDVLPRTNLLSGVMLCCWDNIAGPKVEHVWLPMSSHAHFAVSEHGDNQSSTDRSVTPTPSEHAGHERRRSFSDADGKEGNDAGGSVANRSTSIHSSHIPELVPGIEVTRDSSDNFSVDSESQASIFSLPGGPIPVSAEVQNHAARHVLAGELARSDPQSEDPAVIETKFHVFADIGFAVTATMFIAPGVPIPLGTQTMAARLAQAHRDGEAQPQGMSPQMAAQMAAMMSIGSSNQSAPVKHALCLLLSPEHLEKYLSIHHIVEDRLHSLAGKLQALLGNSETRPDALELFNEHVLTAVHNIECVFEAGIPNVALNRTVWWNPWGYRASELNDGTAPYDARFLGICVTSHLCTMGCTVVVGSDIVQVNQMIDSLLCFSLAPGDHRRAAYATSTSEEFVPGMSIQGMITPDGLQQARSRQPSYSSTPGKESEHRPSPRKNSPAVRIHDQLVIQSLSPVTVIDLDRRRVQQTHPYHEFKLLRESFLEDELARMVPRSQPLPDNRWTATLAEGLFVSVKTPSPLIMECLQTSRALPSILRGGFLRASVQGWRRVAVCLMKYVEAEVALHVQRQMQSLALGASPDSLPARSPSGQENAPATGDQPPGDMEPSQPSVTLDAETVSRIRAELRLDSNEDWAMVLAIAERLSPGIYVACAGDPAAIEEKFLELFESF